jgi:hypothetical protein
MIDGMSLPFPYLFAFKEEISKGKGAINHVCQVVYRPKGRV